MNSFSGKATSAIENEGVYTELLYTWNRHWRKIITCYNCNSRFFAAETILRDSLKTKARICFLLSSSQIEASNKRVVLIDSQITFWYDWKFSSHQIILLLNSKRNWKVSRAWADESKAQRFISALTVYGKEMMYFKYFCHFNMDALGPGELWQEESPSIHYLALH